MSDCCLYAISPSEFELESFKTQVEDALKDGGVAVFQLRMKDASDEIFTRNALELQKICKKYGVPFIINDRIDIAIKIKADGVHIGVEDKAFEGTHIEELRKTLGDQMVIGVSCYGSKHYAMTAAEQGADYVSFGQFYETKTKPPKGRPGVDILEWWSTYTNVKCAVIGGIKPDNLAEIVRNGADFIAVVTGIWEDAEGPANAVKKYNKAIKEALGSV